MRQRKADNMSRPSGAARARADLQPNNLQPDQAAIREFLDSVLDRDWFHLLYKNPDDESRTFPGTVRPNLDDAVLWIANQNASDRGRAGNNIYYPINLPDKRQAKRALKVELKWLMGHQVDIDLPKGMHRQDPKAESYIDGMVEAVLSLPVPGRPCIVRTGNGIQAFWPYQWGDHLKATLENKSLVETINKRIATALRRILGDKAKVEGFDSNRVFRVPGTVNWPSPLKVSRGCVPVLSTLECVNDRAFAPEDFGKLPKVEPVKVRNPAAYVDFTRYGYTEGYEPLTAKELIEDKPDLDLRMRQFLADTDEGEDRSRSTALWMLYQELKEFFMRKLNASALDLSADKSALCNMANMCLDLRHVSPTFNDIMGHVDDHPQGAGKLGYDIGNMLSDAIDAGEEPAPNGEKRATARRERHETLTTPQEEKTPHEARVSFLAYAQFAINRDGLPIVARTKDNDTAQVQPVTESNVREIMLQVELDVSWNDMRDEPYIVCTREQAHADGAPVYPAEDWAHALSNTSLRNRPYASLALALDVLALAGIRDRNTAEVLLVAYAQEKRFHPLEGYCLSRPWDGVDRYASVARCLHTDNDMVVVYLRTFFRQCIATVLSMRRFQAVGDGLQISGSVLLVGPQGCGKSSFWLMVTPPGMMAGGTSLGLGSGGDRDHKKECLSGLVCCLNEIGGTFKKSDVDRLKDFLTRTWDSYRLPYGKVWTEKGRGTVFCGTANILRLSDETGSRRYRAVVVTGVDLDALAQIDIQQVYAQAWHEVMEEEKRYWLSGEQERRAALLNEPHQDVLDEEVAARDYMALADGENYRNDWYSARQICKAIGLRYYSPWAWGHIAKVLREHNVEYRAKVRRKDGPPLQKVWHFPMTAAMAATVRDNA